MRRRYIDFAAANRFGGVLVEGWNTGLGRRLDRQPGRFSFTRAYPDYDLAGGRGVRQTEGCAADRHNETSGGIQNYERQLDSAFALYRSLGLDAIKTGYVTDLTSEGHSHYSQFMVQHYRKVIETAARYGIMVDAHEPMHDTGERRTYPNMMSREGARGQEYNAWSGDGGNPPEHEIHPVLHPSCAGPDGLHPGIFDLLIERGTGRPRRPDEPRVRTTLAKQLALYVVLYSPLQMAADLPENSSGSPRSSSSAMSRATGTQPGSWTPELATTCGGGRARGVRGGRGLQLGRAGSLLQLMTVSGYANRCSAARCWADHGRGAAVVL
jgi:alpha-glucosidase